MFAEKFISADLPFISSTTQPEYALKLMEKYNIRHLPIVENRKYLGLYTCLTEKNACAGPCTVVPESEHLYLYANQHVFDAVQLVIDNQLTIAPVLNENDEYLGAITPNEMAKCFAEVVRVDENGAVIILEVEQFNYSLTQIASIVESNHGKILNVFLSEAPEDHNVYVNIKINTEEISSIVLTFERYGYRIAHIFADTKQLRDTHDRYNALMAYLTI